MKKSLLLCLIAFFLIFVISCSDPAGSGAMPSGETNPSGTPGDTDPSGTPVDTDPSGTPGDTNPSGTPGDTNPSGTSGDTDPSGTPGDTDPSRIIEVNNGSVSKDLSELETGNELVFKMNESGKLNLSGVTIDSLYAVENEGSAEKSLSRGINQNLSSVDKKGLYLLVPQEGGELSFSGSDVGLAQGNGLVRLKKIGNDLSTGSNYVQYKVAPTDIDYDKEGYPEYKWPTYQNYVHIDLNNDQWSYAKDKEVVIVQHIYHDDNESHGGDYNNRFGLIKNGEITYSDNISGLYDLAGKDSLNLYTFLRLSRYKGDNSYMRTYIIVPEELEIGATPLDIVPHSTVFKVVPEDNTTHEIRITDCEPTEFTDLIDGILEGLPRYFDGTGLGEIFWVKDIIGNEDNKTMSATLCFKGATDSFILDNYVREKKESESLGKISFVKSLDQDQSWIDDVKNNPLSLEDFDSHTIDIVKSNPGRPFLNCPVKIEDSGKTYKLTVTNKAEKYALRFFYMFQGKGAIEYYGNGHREHELTVGKGTINPGRTAELILHPGMEGYFTIFTLNKNVSFDYQLTEIQEND